MNTGLKKTGVLKSALKKTPKYNADVEMDFKNPVSYNKSNTNRKYDLKVKESDNSIGLSNDSINGHHSSVYTNLNAKRMEMGGNFDSTTQSLRKSNKVLPGSSGKKSKRLKSQYKMNGQNSIIKGLDVEKMSMKRDILTPKKMNKTSKANNLKSNFNDSYETRSYAGSDAQSHKTMQTRRKRMSKSTVYSKQQKQEFGIKNKSKMFKEGYNIHTEFPTLNERKQKTPGLDKRTRKKENRSNRRTQRALNHHYIDGATLQNNKKRNPSQNYEVKTEGYLPAIESLEGKSEYDDYQIDDGLSYAKGGLSVKSYRPHPLKDPSFGKNLKFSSVRIANMSKFKTLYLVNLREKMEECQKPAVPQERFVKIMDTNREISIPKLEQEEVQEEEEDNDINIYSDSDQFEEEKGEAISSRANTPENVMIKRLKTKVAKGLHMQGKITMMPGVKATSSMVKRKFEQSKDFKIALEMMSDLHTVDQFRTIQKSEFLTRNPFEDIEIMT